MSCYPKSCGVVSSKIQNIIETSPHSQMRIFAYILFSILFFSGIQATPSFAENTGEYPLFLTTMSTWSNGPVTTLSPSSVTNHFEGAVDASTLPPSAYSSYFFNAAKKDWRGIGAIRFDINNPNNEVLKLNFIIKDTESATLTLEEKSLCILVDSLQRYEVVSPVNGAIVLPSGYSGELIIPFSELSSQGETRAVSKSESWGILLFSEERKSQKIIFGNFSLIPEKKMEGVEEILNRAIIGTSEITIPMAGEKTALYQIRQEVDNNPVFSLEKNIPGLFIHKRGDLTLTAEANEGSLCILAESNDGFIMKKTVALTLPYTVKETMLSGTTLQIPQANQAGKVYDASSLLYHRSFYKFISYSGIFLSFVLLLFYQYLRHRSKGKKEKSFYK